MKKPCAVADCTDRRMVGELCWQHYQMWEREVGTCSVNNCEHPVRARGWCNAHYLRWRKYGDPLMISAPTPLAERLRAKLEVVETGCIEYRGRLNANGYGTIFNEVGAKPRQILTHRASWILAHGPIPNGLMICHHCDNPPCCNVAHLFLGTAEDNMRDMAQKGRGRKSDAFHGINRTWVTGGSRARTDFESLGRRAYRNEQTFE